MVETRLAQYGGYIFIVNTAMTPLQVRLIQESLPKLARRSGEASDVFYDRLFAIRPELRALFPSDLSLQKAKFVQMVSVLIKNLDQVNSVSDQLCELGRRHASYEVSNDHYAYVGEALLWMLGKVLGQDFTLELQEAWQAAYEMLAHIMQAASEVPHTAEGFFGSIIRSVMVAQYGINDPAERKSPATPVAAIQHAQPNTGRVLHFP